MPEWLKITAAVIVVSCVAGTSGVVLTDSYVRTHSPTYEYAAPSNEGTARNDASAQHVPSFVEWITGRTAEANAEEKQQARRERAANDRELTAYTGQLAKWTIGLVAVAAIQAALFVWQLGLMKAGVIDAAKAAEATRDTATALAAANTINMESVVSSRRAWLSINDFRLIEGTIISEDEITFSIEFTVSNIGNTPALGVRALALGHCLSDPIQTHHAARLSFVNQTRGWPDELGTTLFPDDPLVQRVTWHYNAEQIALFLSHMPEGHRALNFILFAGVGYRIVGDRKRHITMYQYSLMNVRFQSGVITGHVDIPRSRLDPGEID